MIEEARSAAPVIEVIAMLLPLKHATVHLKRAANVARLVDAFSSKRSYERGTAVDEEFVGSVWPAFRKALAGVLPGSDVDAYIARVSPTLRHYVDALDIAPFSLRPVYGIDGCMIDLLAVHCASTASVRVINSVEGPITTDYIEPRDELRASLASHVDAWRIELYRFRSPYVYHVALKLSSSWWQDHANVVVDALKELGFQSALAANRQIVVVAYDRDATAEQLASLIQNNRTLSQEQYDFVDSADA
jgi:hypothetical protein